MKLKTIKVYGRLKKFLGSSCFEAAVSSPVEAIRFLLCNFPEVEKHMSQQYYKIRMNNIDVPSNLLSMKGKGDIEIIPVAMGSAMGIQEGATVSATGPVGGALLQIPDSEVAKMPTEVQAALRTTRSQVERRPEATENVYTGSFAQVQAGNTAMSILDDSMTEGASYLVSPVSTPFDRPTNIGASIPSGSIDPQIANSYSFSGIQNVSISGVSVPIIYGEVFTGSIVISSGIDTVQVEGTT